jgi:hypothetical protein
MVLAWILGCSLLGSVGAIGGAALLPGSEESTAQDSRARQAGQASREGSKFEVFRTSNFGSDLVSCRGCESPYG